MFIRFRKSLPTSASVIRSGTGSRRVTVPPKAVCGSIAELERRVGFGIVRSERPPLGMKFAYGEVVPMGGRNVAVLRYTDGLACASVYQVRAPEPLRTMTGFSGPNRTVVFTVHGAKCTITGDLGENGIRRFVLAFEAGKAPAVPAQVSRPPALR
jgi:hypothetical protein